MKTEQDTIEELESKLAAARRSYRLWKALVIVPIVASIALYFLNSLVMNFFRARSSPQIVACYSNLHHIGVALEMYSTDYSGNYPKDIGLITPNYLRDMPQCPKAGEDTYSESYQMEEPSEEQRWGSYSFYCSGENHAELGIPANYPAYNSVEGLIERPW